MATRPRSSSSPGPGRGSKGRQSARSTPTTRRTTQVTSDVPAARIASSRAKLTGRAAVLLVVMAVLAVSYASSMRAWLKQRSDVNQLNAQIAQQRADVGALQLDRQRWRDPAYIETQARLRFGWIMPGETGYRVLGPDGEVLADGGSELADATEPKPLDTPEWWESQWDGIAEAGKDPAEAETTKDAEPKRTPAERIGGGGREKGSGAGDR